MKNFLTTLFILMSTYVNGKVFNVMAPLTVDNFDHFAYELREMKKLGATGVSTDVWWGLVEKQDQQFDWSYYDKLSSLIIDSGLKWVPILSFHQCGGNVGDTCNIPIPSWLWSKYGQGAMTKSEQGNFSKEFLSVWTTKKAISDYSDFMSAFKNHFHNKKNDIYEINISLGPAGELRYPSYNSHDQNTGYPTRGAIQAYSSSAIQSFKQYIKEKYKTVGALNNSWGFNLNSFELVMPPTPSLFYSKEEQETKYGQDFYEWYSKSLRDHGRELLSLAVDTFRNYGNAQLGVKVPGIHWRVATGGDRMAELNAGLISTDQNIYSDKTGHGYNRIISMISDLKKEKGFDLINLHFTCLEMDNNEGPEYAQSYAKALVFWVAQEAQRQGVRILGENALAGTLYSQRAWDNIENALLFGGYDGVTFLRMGNVLGSSTGRSNFRNLVETF